MNRSTVKSLAVLGLLLLGSGCVAVGSSARTTPPTLGRQLIDLKTAYDQGAINEAEYEEAKGTLLSEVATVAQG